MHGIELLDYIIKHVHGGKRPTCGCGCGSPVTFRKGAFKRFKHGHAARDPALRSMMIEAGRAAARDPEKRKKNSAALKAKWHDDPGYCARVHSPENVKRRVEAIRMNGKKPEFKEKMKRIKEELWRDEAWADKQRKMFSSEAFSRIVSTTTEMALSTTKKHAKMSSAARLSYAEGRKRPKSNWTNIKSGYRSDPFYPANDIWFDSGWEHEFMVLCFEARVTCLREPFIIPYMGLDVSMASYFPDFLVGDRIIVEVKGQENENDRLKYDAGLTYASANGLSYVVLKKNAFSAFIRGLTDGQH